MRAAPILALKHDSLRGKRILLHADDQLPEYHSTSTPWWGSDGGAGLKARDSHGMHQTTRNSYSVRQSDAGGVEAVSRTAPALGGCLGIEKAWMKLHR